MRKLPTNYTDLYDVMVTIATHLPRAWQDWIDDAVERAVEAERRGKKFRQMVFRHIEELMEKEFA